MNKYVQVAMAASALMVVQAQAGLTVNISRVNGYYYGSGGEFKAVPGGGLEWVLNNYSGVAKYGAPVGFGTFCLEATEYTGGSQVVLNNNAVDGGVGPSGDPLSQATAYLYYQFAQGTLTGYNYTPGAGREASARGLQEAIWYLEGEGSLTAAATPFVNAANSALGASAALNNWNGSVLAYPVMAMNITFDDGSRSQDMLVVVPEPGTYIAGALLGLPFLAGAVRRMRRNQAA